MVWIKAVRHFKSGAIITVISAEMFVESVIGLVSLPKDCCLKLQGPIKPQQQQTHTKNAGFFAHHHHHHHHHFWNLAMTM